MGHKVGGQGSWWRSGVGVGALRCVSLGGLVASLCAALAIAGCGEGTGKSTSAAATTTAATTATATTPTTTTTTKTPATTSTAAKPVPKPSTTTAKTTTTPATTTPAKTSPKPSKPASKEQTFGKIKVTSTAFKAGGAIGVKYTCDGAGISPPLQWRGVPRGTVEMLILAVDLSGDTGDVVQWAVAGIPPTTTGIPEGQLPAGAVAGVNSAGKVGWGGICGSKGHLHRVGFLFYALKHPLGLKSGFNPSVVRNGLKDATLATGLTLATYQR